MRYAFALVLVPLIAFAQPVPPTAFPEDSVPLEAEALQRYVTGKVFVVKPVVGSEFRIEYKESFAYINIGNNSDSGPWKVKGSSICYEWRKFVHSCSEARLAGGVLYVKRANNGEIVALRP